ncbi:MAG: hypothetical protein H6618_03115 [Deltaproteobacteria bacterium]|nr:hypothetical protein [Deltaproteobacteria bacterium]
MNVRFLLLCSAMSLCFTFLQMDILFGENGAKKVFNGRKNLKKVHINLGKYKNILGFEQRRVDRSANEHAAKEFLNLDQLVQDDRFVSSHYLGVFVVHMTLAQPFTEKDRHHLDQKSSFPGHEILEKGSFATKNKGIWWKCLQRFVGMNYVKYMVIFGNQYQTDIVAAFYEERYSRTFIPSLMKQMIALSYISDEKL